MSNKIEIYDSTLRDGSQGEGISFSLDDKLSTAIELDKLGISFIEGGWPFSNVKDENFFKLIQKENLKHAQIAAFGSTRRANTNAKDDKNLNALLYAESPVITIFGKSWDLHVTDALKVSFEENLAMIASSIEYLKQHDRHVIYDAEHFFDGYKSNPEYAIKTILAAQNAGASTLVLCDTNGGSLPFEIQKIVSDVKKITTVNIGIHAHNDSGLGVANSLSAVEGGAKHIQGTINGIGERCGNADITSIIANLELKMNKQCLPDTHIQKLTETSHFVWDITNQNPIGNQPFVGISAFAHKGGIHVSAIARNSKTYEHIKPEAVGNTQRILISELSGKSNVLAKSKKHDLSKHPEALKQVLAKVVELEKEGYSFESAEASFELLIRKIMGDKLNFFKCEGYRSIIENSPNHTSEISEVSVKVRVGEKLEHKVAEGHGPVDAIKRALRRSLVPHYPQLNDMKLVDYKVRVIEGGDGTSSKVRVLITSKDKKDLWSTIGVSENILEASFKALVDSFEYKLVKDN